MRKNSLHQLFVFIVAVGLGLTAVCAQAQDKVTLKWNLPLNQAWDMTMSMDMVMKLKVSANGQDRDLDQKMSMMLSGQSTPLEIKDGAPVKVKMSFNNDCKISMSMMGRDQNLPFPLAGKTVTLTRNADGDIDVAPADAFGKQNKDMLKNLMDSIKAYYPDHPVGVGDSWEIKGEAASKAFQLGPDGKGSITCTLNKFGDANGRKSAEISIKGDVAGSQNGMGMSMKMTGPMVIDVATGQALSSEINANMTLNGTGATPVSGTGVMCVKQTNTAAK